jgi:hypothetical protein
VVLVLALAVVSAASASSGSHFSGKTKQHFVVSFRTTSKSVVGFKTSSSVLCRSVVTGASKLVIYPILLQSPYPLKKASFTITFKGESSTKIVVTGLIKGGSASGKLNVSFSKTIGTTSSGLLDIAACQLKTTWTARQT